MYHVQHLSVNVSSRTKVPIGNMQRPLDTEDILIEKAHYITTELSVAFVGSNSWLQGFKGQYGICGQTWSVNENDVSAVHKQIQDLLKEYKLWNIYNMDETGLYYQKPLDKDLTTRQMSGVKGDKTQITLAFTVNADGSDIHKPLFIGWACRPHCFGRNDGLDLGFDYHWNRKAWMTSKIFEM